MPLKITVEKVGERRLILSPLYKRVDKDGRVFLTRELADKEVLVLVAQPKANDKTSFVPVGRPKHEASELLRKDICDFLSARNREFGEIELIERFGESQWGVPLRSDYQFLDAVVEELQEQVWTNKGFEWDYNKLAKDLCMKLPDYYPAMDEEDDEDIKRYKIIIDLAVGWLKNWLETEPVQQYVKGMIELNKSAQPSSSDRKKKKV